MKLSTLIATFVLFFGFVLAEVARSDERMLPLIDWITENSDLEYNGEELPEVTQVPYGVLEIMTYGDIQVAQAEQNGNELPEVHGIYNHETHEIVFPDNVNPWDELDVMIHELVHVLQYFNREPPDCVRSWEKQAYELHWQWVEETGYEAEEPNWLFVFLLDASCDNPHM